MSFTNPAGQAAAAAAEYVASMLSLLGDRDPFEVQEELIPALEAATSGLDEVLLRQPAPAGEPQIDSLAQR
jgi:hypothetical protein